jgi:hypothetical protein
MTRSGSRAGWWIVIPAILLAGWVVGSAMLARRGEVRIGRLIGSKGLATPETENADRAGKNLASAIVEHMDDPRLGKLRQAAEGWRRSAASRRVVVDQVCLVSDLPTFLEAIAAWDERHYFPILIDEPAWTIPFLRQFHPARVVRYRGRKNSTGSSSQMSGASAPARGETVWLKAVEAVRRACSTPPEPGGVSKGAANNMVPAAQTPGLVLADPESATIGAAVALAAGHFQPLVRLGAFHLPPGVRGAAESTRRFGDMLTLVEAWGFAHGIEARVSTAVGRYDQLGDDCDFLTLAGDWPYRYQVEEGEEPVRGIYALDDLIGRTLAGGPSLHGIEMSSRRWAYVGRIIGDPAASVARAMGSLFLHPRSTLLWNTYGGGTPWSTYTMQSAGARLSRVVPGPIEHAEGPQSDLKHWHTTFAPVNRFGLLLINTTGGPDFFSIGGGPGRPGDVPRGVFSAVAMIHSFSAANPADPQTIAGRWLENGAYVYFGAVQEPFLVAFRPPGLVSELIAADVPLVAALRQSEREPCGFPWRLVYLGDPLYRAGREPRDKNALATAGKTDGSKGPEQTGAQWSWWSSASGPSNLPEREGHGRIDAGQWAKAAAAHDLLPVVPIVAMDATVNPPVGINDEEFDGEKLQTCIDAAIAEAAMANPLSTTTAGRGAAGVARLSQRGNDWRTLLRQIRRDRLEEELRLIYDELLIDALEQIGAIEELQSALAKIPPEEACPRVWQAHELCAFDRLARLAQDRTSETFDAALRIWDEAMGLSWPKGSRFPAQLTERVAAMTRVDPGRRLAVWQEQLQTTARRLEEQRERYPHVGAIIAEQTRVEAQRARR